ncbi:Transcriptional regulatory protein sin3 [Coniosporium tulheliwenetii]|uniref:Transcriptional regulatory protein sin3 n=1 Tax=Coniosporium tulheliwenetii TaxID=3383036 RepID=A0ACC2ZLF4_9PEZI|nr:Transcriptional regulatory protein sin3 [Cladosporium sp. JES 115]
MNPANRDGWPPSQGSAPNAGPQSLEQDPAQPGRQLGGFGVHPSPQQQPSQQPSNQPSGHVLPPPSAPFFSPGQASGHSLPALASLSQPTQSSPPGQPAPRPQSSVQETNFSLPTINQAMPGQQHTQSQSGIERERDLREDREKESLQRHLDEAAARDAETREREMRQRQQQERAQHENHTGPIHLHQPVAVPPQVRAMHGPNGLLGNAAINGPNHLGGQLGAPNGPGNLFSGNPTQHSGQTQQTLMVPFGGTQGLQQASLGMGQGQQPILNDALSYLDQVKVQFVAHPDVYNRFLDIMKDFKSGAIDTPGVIDRVSSLFAGNPNLIQGFNTFLPPGYKIECGTRDDPNAIRVTTPMGTTVSAMPVARAFSPQGMPVNGNGPAVSERQLFGGAGEARAEAGNLSSKGLQVFGGQLAQSNQAPLLSPEAQAREQQAAASAVALAQHQQEQRGVSQLQNAVSAATGGALPRPGMMSPSADMSTPLPGQGMNGIGLAAQHSGQGAMEKRGPVEFNHAISYVNKIKNRFASQPDIYKQFLEILQTYQRESKPIQDVYAQVTHLFNSAPDLLEDFKQFLPESAAQAKAAEAQRRAAEESVMLSNIRGEPSYQAQVQQMQQTPRADQPRLPPMGNFAPTPTANRENKRKRPDRQGAAAGPSTMASMAVEASGAPMRTGFNQGGNASKRSSKHQHGAKQAVPADVPAVSPTLTPALPEPLPPTSSSGASVDELNFFDRCKKFIGNKNTMNEFLKLCNLFSMDLIDKITLVHRAQNFIGGNPELMAWFKKFLAYDGKDELIENLPKA